MRAVKSLGQTHLSDDFNTTFSLENALPGVCGGGGGGWVGVGYSQLFLLRRICPSICFLPNSYLLQLIFEILA